MTTLDISITNGQASTIGEYLDNHGIKAVARRALRLAGISGEHILNEHDQELILFHALLLGDSAIAKHLYGKTEPETPMKAAKFLIKLVSAIRSVGNAAKRQMILDKTRGATVVCFKHANGGRLIVHPAVRQDRTSDWQLTTISYDGQPWGHVNPPSFEEALFRAMGASKDGYWNEHNYEYEWSNNLDTPPPV